MAHPSVAFPAHYSIASWLYPLQRKKAPRREASGPLGTKRQLSRYALDLSVEILQLQQVLIASHSGLLVLGEQLLCALGAGAEQDCMISAKNAILKQKNVHCAKGSDNKCM